MERNKEKRLGKSRADKKITGVCGGIAAYLGLSPKSVRILCFGLYLLFPNGILAYLLLAAVLPFSNSQDAGR